MGTRRAQMLTFPAWTATNIGITSLQVLSACTSGIGEANGDNAGYSKFADATATWNVPSRVGMFIIYIAGLLVSMWVIPSAESPRTIMIAWMLFGGPSRPTAALLPLCCQFLLHRTQPLALLLCQLM